MVHDILLDIRLSMYVFKVGVLKTSSKLYDNCFILNLDHTILTLMTLGKKPFESIVG